MARLKSASPASCPRTSSEQSALSHTRRGTVLVTQRSQQQYPPSRAIRSKTCNRVLGIARAPPLDRPGPAAGSQRACRRASEAGMKRFIVSTLAAAALVAAAAPARAQDQGFSVNFGYFWPKGSESRASGDVLNANKCLDVNVRVRAAALRHRRLWRAASSAPSTSSVSGASSRSAAASATSRGPRQRSTSDFQDIDGSEIDSDLKLKIVPITGIVRVVPTGRRAPIQPYAGIGIAALRWHYSESGEFLDPRTLEIFRDQFKADGTEVAPVYLGGVRAPDWRQFPDRRGSALHERRRGSRSRASSRATGSIWEGRRFSRT